MNIFGHFAYEDFERGEQEDEEMEDIKRINETLDAIFGEER